jgi:hypothetical protein
MSPIEALELGFFFAIGSALAVVCLLGLAGTVGFIWLLRAAFRNRNERRAKPTRGTQ